MVAAPVSPETANFALPFEALAGTWEQILLLALCQLSRSLEYTGLTLWHYVCTLFPSGVFPSSDGRKWIQAISC